MVIYHYIALYLQIMRRVRDGREQETETDGKDGLYHCYIGQKELLGNCFAI